MNSHFAETILATFHSELPHDHFARLASIPRRVWADSYFWLDASGLTLYFLDRIKSLGLYNAVPKLVLARFEQNLIDNELRTKSFLGDLLSVNDALNRSSVDFVNVKGITLVPHACSNASLRLQLDLDFLTTSRHAQQCQAALKPLGYELVAVGRETWEFKTKSPTVPSVDDLYKAKPQRSVEIHFATEEELRDFSIPHTIHSYSGHHLPVLSAECRFLAQATHLMKHLRSEWLRLSWLLEFREAATYWRNDDQFWQNIHSRASVSTSFTEALAASTLMASAVFGSFSPHPLLGEVVNKLDEPMRLWLERYGRKAVLADFPGTKLYLLQPPSRNAPNSSVRERRLRLLPTRRPIPIVPIGKHDGLASRISAWKTQTVYLLFRLRFHIREGLRYRREAPRWRKHLAEIGH